MSDMDATEMNDDIYFKRDDPETWDKMAAECEASYKTSGISLVLVMGLCRSVPSIIGNCTKLQSLILYGTELITLPPQIGCLRELKQLATYGCGLLFYPYELTRCSRINRVHGDCLYIDLNSLIGRRPFPLIPSASTSVSDSATATASSATASSATATPITSSNFSTTPLSFTNGSSSFSSLSSSLSSKQIKIFQLVLEHLAVSGLAVLVLKFVRSSLPCSVCLLQESRPDFVVWTQVKWHVIHYSYLFDTMQACSTNAVVHMAHQRCRP